MIDRTNIDLLNKLLPSIDEMANAFENLRNAGVTASQSMRAFVAATEKFQKLKPPSVNLIAKT